MAAQTQVLVSAPTRPRWGVRLNPAYVFLLPYLVAMIMFSLGPAVYAFILMFATFKVGKPQFFTAGLTNIVTALKDPDLLPAFENLGRFLLVSFPFVLVFVVLLP